MQPIELWVIDYNDKKILLHRFENGWFFTPLIKNILFTKYVSEKFIGKIEKKQKEKEEKHYIKLLDLYENGFEILNEEISKANIKNDKVLWALSNYKKCFTRHKRAVVKIIRQFFIENKQYISDINDISFDRINEIISGINNIDEEQYKKFFFSEENIINIRIKKDILIKDYQK